MVLISNIDQIRLHDIVFIQVHIPQNKTKKAKGDQSETVPNGNYLWINMFATALNKRGRAALVMANSASDAGNSEKEIRKKLIEEGLISQMLTMPKNMFSTVTLPATLWFFDRHKKNKDERSYSSTLGMCLQ